jgi:hypothetical protein
MYEYNPQGRMGRRKYCKRIDPFIFIYLWHEKEVVGQFQDPATSSLEYKAELFPDAVWTI